MGKQTGGSARPFQIDFRLNETTLTCKSQKAKLAHDQVVEYSKKDILGLKDVRWTSSTYVDKSRFPKHEADCRLSATFGLAGHTVRDPDILWSRPALPGPWNASTEINRRTLKKTLENSMQGDHRNTLKRSAHLAGYVDPAAAQSPDVRRTRSLSPPKRACRCPDAHPNGHADDFSPRRRRKNRPARREDVEEVERLDTWQPPIGTGTTDKNASTTATAVTT